MASREYQRQTSSKNLETAIHVAHSILRASQRHRMRINDAEPLEGISSVDASQAQLVQTLKVRKPTRDAQLTLL